MNEPSKEAREDQQRQRQQGQVAKILAAWAKSEAVLDILRCKKSKPHQPTHQEIITWAQQNRI